MTRRQVLCAHVLVIGLLFSIRPGWADDQQQITLAHSLSFVDATGAAVTTDDFAGKWLLIYFGYTHCADQCPTALSSIVEALDDIGPASDRIQPLFITVDPDRDHGPALAAFTRAFDTRLVGLTGSMDQIAAAAHALGIKYERVFADSDDYVIDHSTTLTVIGPDRHQAVTFAMAEPYMIAQKLIAILDQAGVALGNVNNLGAWR
ncbi:MAG: SCO family protein [Alphaproteobacteria bacterium]|nr:SCO family protein [Alphaproteobacteria bacterium]